MSQNFSWILRLIASIFHCNIDTWSRRKVLRIKKTINSRTLQCTCINQLIIADFIKRNVWCAITRIATLIFNLIPPKTKHKQIALSWFNSIDSLLTMWTTNLRWHFPSSLCLCFWSVRMSWRRGATKKQLTVIYIYILTLDITLFWL